MTRINTNVESLTARRALHLNNRSLTQALERLSTGLRINSGRDDPAGLIASENLRSSLNAITAAVDNANRADTVVSIAEGGLQEVSSLLLELESLVDRSHGNDAIKPEPVPVRCRSSGNGFALRSHNLLLGLCGRQAPRPPLHDRHGDTPANGSAAAPPAPPPRHARSADRSTSLVPTQASSCR